MISFAISASRILDSAAVKFSLVVAKLLIVCSNLFCCAPIFARCIETLLIAPSNISSASFALSCVKMPQLFQYRQLVNPLALMLLHPFYQWKPSYFDQSSRLFGVFYL